MGRINQPWHQAHKMPRNATLQQRVDWHLAHAVACACRPMPATVRAALERGPRPHRAARPKTVRSTKGYDDLIASLYGRVGRTVTEIEVPVLTAISVSGNQPPASPQYQNAIAALYGIGYGLAMGLKHGKIARPAGYFDYKVGALHTFWWSTGRKLEIRNPRTLRWQAWLMVPSFVTRKLLDEARSQATSKHPEIAYDHVELVTIDQGRAVQMLHVGPYAEEERTIAALHAYMAEHGLRMAGKHLEVYISDPRRTRPEKLKTVIRWAVEADRASTRVKSARTRRSSPLPGSRR